jgi:cytochrome c biogenesis protein CcmG/thiol:disulfide interchange protein DsbE
MLAGDIVSYRSCTAYPGEVSARLLASVAVGALLLTGCGAEPEVAEAAERPERSADTQALIDRAALDACPERTDGVDLALPGLPAVILPCLGDGPAVDLSLVRGTPLVVNVWASWCPPCIAEMPMLAQAARDYAPDVRFLGVDLQDDPNAALEMLAELDVDFPSVVDDAGIVRSSLSIPGPPVTFFVDASGVIVGRWDGAIPDREIFDQLMQTFLSVQQ